MKFSIIIPVFNREAYISKTLESVIGQTYSDLEIICVDDCSDDNGLALLNNYAKKDNRVKIFTHQKNIGLYAARKTGVQNASGDYVLFLDCDDALYLDALNILYNALCKNPVEILEYGYQSIYSKDITIPNVSITLQNLFSSFVYAEQPRAGTVWNKVYKAELLKNSFAVMKDFYAVMGEDFYESVIIAYYAKSYSAINDVLVFYDDASGVSNTRKNIAGIKKDLNSIGNILNGFRIFFETHAVEHKNTIKNIERYYIRYMYFEQILLKVNNQERKLSIDLLKDVFSDEAVAPFLNKSSVSVLFDVIIYRMRARLKKFIPKNVRVLIRKMFE